MITNGRDYRRFATTIGIAGPSSPQPLHRFLDDGGWCFPLGLAARQEQHIVAAQGLFAGTEVNVPFLRAETGEAIGNGSISHDRSF